MPAPVGAPGGGSVVHRPVTPPPRAGGVSMGDEGEVADENDEGQFYPVGAVIECVLTCWLHASPTQRPSTLSSLEST